ncbi:MAG TPA: MlaD family protein [Gemmatimonadales bacterium]|nr:MlaD family protein [Gemmatimonadales bacterium]
MRRRKGSELATGALVLVAGAVAVWGYFWLTSQPLGHGGYPLVVQLTDAGGLERGDRVRLAGVEVGTVRHVGLRDGAVLADITVDRDLSLPRDSRASLQASGAFGGRYLALQPGKAEAILGRGDTLAARNIPTLAETFATVGTEAGEAFARASDLLSPDRVADLERGARSLSHSVDELTALTVALRATAAGVRRRVDDKRLDSTAADLALTARTLTGTSAELRAASASLRSILGKIDQGHGSLGQAVNDPALYRALVTAATHVDEAAVGARALVHDLRARPARYIRVSLF